MNEPYRHTQIGVLMIAFILLSGAFGVALLLAGLWQAAADEDKIVLAATIAILLWILTSALAGLHSFTIHLSSKSLALWFGIGVGKREIALAHIRSASVVHNPWYYMWGVKRIPGGWLYGIAPAPRAVELVLVNGKMIRLLTDRPEEIVQRLQQRPAGRR